LSERTRQRPVHGDLGMATEALFKYTRLTRAERDVQLAEAGRILRGAFANNFGLAIKHKKALMSAIAAGLGKGGKLYGRKRVTPPKGVAVSADELTLRKRAESVRASVIHYFERVMNAAFPGQLDKHKAERSNMARGRKRKEAWHVYVLKCRPRQQRRDGGGSGSAGSGQANQVPRKQ